MNDSNVLNSLIPIYNHHATTQLHILGTVAANVNKLKSLFNVFVLALSNSAVWCYLMVSTDNNTQNMMCGMARPVVSCCEEATCRCPYLHYVRQVDLTEFY